MISLCERRFQMRVFSFSFSLSALGDRGVVLAWQFALLSFPSARQADRVLAPGRHVIARPPCPEFVSEVPYVH